MDIHTAARRGYLDRVEACFNNDGPTTLDSQNTISETPLVIAVVNDRLKLVKWLYEKKARLDVILPNGNTVVHCAAGNRHPQMLEYLLALEGTRSCIDTPNKVSSIDNVGSETPQ